MRFAKQIFPAVLTLALAVYAFDCGATTPQQAMECCKSMPCSSQGHHGQDCCNTMPAMHAPFVQPTSVHGISYSPVVVAAVAGLEESRGGDSSARFIAERSHPPPIICTQAPPPLRI